MLAAHLADIYQLQIDIEQVIIDFIAITENDRALDGIFQLADIARPDIGGYGLNSLWREIHLVFAQSITAAFEHGFGNLENILAAFAQGRQLKAHDTDAIVKVFPEFMFARHGLEVAVGGADQPDVNNAGVNRANSANFVLLNKAQQSRLSFHGQLANLIQEESAAVGRLNQADTVGIGAGKSAFFVAKQL